jgi:hypothetical protein
MDLYEEARKHLFTYSTDEDLAVIEETRLHQEEGKADKAGELDISDCSDDSNGKGDVTGGEDEGEPVTLAAGGRNHAPRRS